ncbi:MAG: 6-phosphogluconolactonase [Actinomycetota bacterium]|nr:6-phosphogluconolactonase [Actinomycetota bacterium]
MPLRINEGYGGGGTTRDSRLPSPSSASGLNVEVAEPNQLGVVAAAHLVRSMQEAVLLRGQCAVAFSGGSTPKALFEALPATLPWSKAHVFQADERAVPAGHPERNLTALRSHLLDRVPIPPTHVHAMPMMASDLSAAARAYEQELRDVCGNPPVLDVVHLGLGEDGHTASLVPDDPVLHVCDADVAVTRPYHGHRRLTLTYPALNRSRRILWLVAGAGKAAALRQLLDRDPSIPASGISREQALVVADSGAMTP